MTEKQLAKACLEVQYMHLGKLWRGHPKRWFSQGIPPKWPSLRLRNYSNLPSLTKKRRRQHIFLQPRNAWTCPGRTCPIQHFRIRQGELARCFLLPETNSKFAPEKKGRLKRNDRIPRIHFQVLWLLVSVGSFFRTFLDLFGDKMTSTDLQSMNLTTRCCNSGEYNLPPWKWPPNNHLGCIKTL